MSLYSTEDSNKFKSPSSNYAKYQKLSQFNKFYLSRNGFSSKLNSKNIQTNNSFLKASLSELTKHITPMKIPRTKIKFYYINSSFGGKKIHSYKNLTNSIIISDKIKNKYNPDILNTEFFSKPKKHIKKINKIDNIKYNSFLYKKTKTKFIRLNTFDYKNGNNCRILNYTYDEKLKINKSIRDIQIKNKLCCKINDNGLSHSMKILMGKANKSSKKVAAFMIKKFDKRLVYDKRENLKEYNKFMNDLKINLNLSKSKSKKIFYYE